ncbi:FAD-dependent oxidoreductase [[Eubacterium] cellulosolvens]
MEQEITMNLQNSRTTPDPTPIGSVLVIGGGVAGVQASLDLADSGFKVYLLDRSTSIGGVMAQLDKTFPTNDCSMCILSPKLVEAGRHPNIELLMNSEVKSVSGSPGSFQVDVLRHPRYVNADRCTGCGQCAAKCPTKVPNEYDCGLTMRKAIYVPFPQAVPLIYSIDSDHCRYFQKGKCGVCAKICKAEAIDYEQVEEVIKLDIGSIIVSTGFELFDPSIIKELGYGIYQNVVTSLDFERILSATGPTEGHVLRPSDQKPPKSLAFLQCIGSRDKKIGNEYCSSVCCMYAIKEAIIATEHAEELKSTIFFMDIRAFGKEFDDYYTRAKDTYGIEFVRSRVASISENPETKDLTLRFTTEDGEVLEREFDMVVLSAGLTVSQRNAELAKALEIDLEEHNFCKTKTFSPLETSQPGIYVCGAFNGPKDIPDSVAQASGAAAMAAADIAPGRGKLIEPKTFPPEEDVRWQRPRIGVFVCHCGINIGGVVDVPAVVEFTKKLPGVVYAEENLYTCSQDSQERIKDIIKEHKLNRVVVASCTPRTHEPLFQNTIREAGLNTYLFEMANIRDQCSWVHMHEPEKATEKSKDLVHMAVQKAYMLEPLKRVPLEVVKGALVIGGGLSGMTAAIQISRQGFEVTLVEHEPELGGNLRKVHSILEDIDPQEELQKVIAKVSSRDNIKVYTSAEIVDINGFVGNFTTKIKTQAQDEVEIKHGVVVVATGAVEYKPEEYLYSQDPRIITQSELENVLGGTPAEQEKKIGNNIKNLKNIVMIQCVGSRNETRPYCSRICCSLAVKNALRLKEQNPYSNVYILYRDIRTYGLKEKYYYKASETGVRFIRFDEDDAPVVELTPDNDLKLKVYDHVLGQDILLNPDLLVLSAAMLPQPDNEELGKMLKVPLSKDKFFLEAHMKLRPVDFATEGVFVCGLAHGIKFIDECISQAAATASRACTILTKDQMESEGIVSYVDESTCRGCGYCVEACPYNAIELKEVNQFGHVVQVAHVNEILCKGCGSCAAACLSGSIQQKKFEDRQIMTMIESFLSPEVLESTAEVEKEIKTESAPESKPEAASGGKV